MLGARPAQLFGDDPDAFERRRADLYCAVSPGSRIVARLGHKCGVKFDLQTEAIAGRSVHP